MVRITDLTRLGVSLRYHSDPMDEHGFNEEELSKRVGLSLIKGRELISGELILTEKIANKLESLFLMSARLSGSVGDKYRQHKACDHSPK